VTDREEAADQLQAVPLEDFVAERKRLARELREAGDREGSAELAKLAKPTPPAWALNRFVRDQPDAIATWLEAAEALRDASEQPDAGLRDAMRLHREATRALLGAVREQARPNGRELSEPMVERIRELLQAATADPDAAERLRAGRVVEGDDEAAAPAPKQRAEQREPAKQRAGDAKRSAKERRDEERARREEERRAREREELEGLVAEAEERLAALRAEADERSEAAATADARLEDARRALARTESESAAASSAAEEAADAARQAERELDKLTAKLRAAS
jgi:hypothetical protein